MKKIHLTQEDKINILLGIFVAAIVAANLLGSKITEIFGVRTSVGILAFPITFVVTDIVADVMGKRHAQSFVFTAFIALLLVLGLTWFSIQLPAHAFFEFGEEYNAIFTSSIRITIASIIAFLISQYHDIWAFHFWKHKTQGKFLWLRNNLSTILSQLIDTTIFMFVAFYATSPKFDLVFIVSLIIPFWINELLRSFALRILFANEGVINNFLTGIGILDQGILFIPEL